MSFQRRILPGVEAVMTMFDDLIKLIKDWCELKFVKKSGNGFGTNVLIEDANGNVTGSTISVSELNCLDGITTNISAKLSNIDEYAQSLNEAVNSNATIINTHGNALSSLNKAVNNNASIINENAGRIDTLEQMHHGNGNASHVCHSIEILPQQSTTAGITNKAYIDFHGNGSSVDFTSRIIESAEGELTLMGPGSSRCKLTNISDPTNTYDASNKNYVDIQLEAIKLNADYHIGRISPVKYMIPIPNGVYTISYSNTNLFLQSNVQLVRLSTNPTIFGCPKYPFIVASEREENGVMYTYFRIIAISEPQLLSTPDGAESKFPEVGVNSSLRPFFLIDNSGINVAIQPKVVAGTRFYVYNAYSGDVTSDSKRIIKIKGTEIPETFYQYPFPIIKLPYPACHLFRESDYTEAVLNGDENPRQLGLYEYSNNTYTKTQDTSCVSAKTYYWRVIEDYTESIIWQFMSQTRHAQYATYDSTGTLISAAFAEIFKQLAKINTKLSL